MKTDEPELFSGQMRSSKRFAAVLGVDQHWETCQ